MGIRTNESDTSSWPFPFRRPVRRRLPVELTSAPPANQWEASTLPHRLLMLVLMITQESGSQAGAQKPQCLSEKQKYWNLHPNSIRESHLHKSLTDCVDLCRNVFLINTAFAINVSWMFFPPVWFSVNPQVLSYPLRFENSAHTWKTRSESKWFHFKVHKDCTYVFYLAGSTLGYYT